MLNHSFHFPLLKGVPPRDSRRQRRLPFSVWLPLALGCIMTVPAASAKLRIGVYQPAPGGKGVLEALKVVPEVEAEPLSALSAHSLFAHDVVVIGSLNGLAAGQESWRRDLRLFVRAGGGLLLEHDACGFRGWEKEVLFPEIVARGLRTSTTNALEVSDSKHPVTKGLPPKLSHAYYDHIALLPGPAGTTLVKDADTAAVVVVGALGEGRIVATGTVTGFASDKTGGQGEKAAEGAELALLLNAVKWLGERPMSQLAPSELAQRLAVEGEEEARAAAGVPPAQKHTKWWAPTMLRERALVRKPVTELGGKVFMWWDTRAAYDYTTLRRCCRTMKLMGVTDVLYCGQGGAEVAHLTKLKFARQMWWVYRYQGKDPLRLILKAAKDEGLGVWIAGHSGEYHESMCARNEKGEFYKCGNNRIDDNLSPALRHFMRDLFHEYSDYRKEFDNLRGFYYDEIFFNSVDFHGDDVKAFSDYCGREFGEPAPADISARFAQGLAWCNPADKWWRRFVLFKAWCNTDFLREVVRYAHEAGLEFILELRPAAQYETGWTFGMNDCDLARLGADHHFVAAGCEPDMVYPNAYTGAHEWAPWGFYYTYALRGKPEMTFVFNLNEYPAVSANPYQLECTARHLRNVREWFGAKSLARACVLTNQMGLVLRHKDPRDAWQREWTLFERLSQFQDLDMMLSVETRLYPNYRALVAPSESLLNLPPATFQGLRSYLAAGGVILSLGGRWTQSRPDFTQEKDVTADFLGGDYADRRVFVDKLQPAEGGAKPIPIAPQEVRPFEPRGEVVRVLALFAQGGPAVTELAVGKGKVVAFHFDVSAEVAAQGEAMLKYLAAILAAATAPEIQSDGTLRLVTTLRKNNWVATTLYADSAPAAGTAKLDLQRLGVQSRFYRVYLYGRDRELEAPGGYWHPKLWTAEQIAAGVQVSIPKMGCEDLQLPDTFDLTGFGKDEQDWIKAVVPSRWKEHETLRRWEHEILVIAPYDELDIEGEKAGAEP